MPSQNNFKTPQFSYEAIPQRMLRRQERIARTLYRPRFERLVRPFESVINIGVESVVENRTPATLIGPLPDSGGINAAGDRMTGQQIYIFLDDGTKVSRVRLPADFSNETFPDSLATVSRSYDRRGIVLTSEERPGIRARNFSKLIDEELEDTYKLRMESELRIALQITT